MKFDLHTHHSRCGHAAGSIEDYIRAAIDAGIGAIGISDHSPYFGREEDHPEPGIAMARSSLAGYVEEVLALKAKYEGKIEVLLGMESDFFPEHADTYRKAYEAYPFDYIIGSVHFTSGRSIFNKTRWKGLSQSAQAEQKREYYELIRQSAVSGMFQVLGHIDAMKGYYPAFSDIPASESIDLALQAIAGSGASIEINTSGKTKTVGGWYPSNEILERAHHFGVTCSFGSDSHVPARVGDDFEEVRALLKSIGFREWFFYRQKQPVAVPL
ncbi:histidinol-phosphatase [Paenibacillus sp. D51F]